MIGLTQNLTYGRYKTLRKAIEHFAVAATPANLRGLRSAGKRVVVDCESDSVLFDEAGVAVIHELSPEIAELITRGQILYVRIITPPERVFCLTQLQYADLLGMARELAGRDQEMIETTNDVLPRIETPNCNAAAVWTLQAFAKALHSALHSACWDSPHKTAIALQRHEHYPRWDQCVSLLSIIEQSGEMMVRILEAESIEAKQPWTVQGNKPNVKEGQCF